MALHTAFECQINKNALLQTYVWQFWPLGSEIFVSQFQRRTKKGLLEGLIRSIFILFLLIVRHYSIGFHTGTGFLKDLQGKVTITLTGSKMTKSITLAE